MDTDPPPSQSFEMSIPLDPQGGHMPISAGSAGQQGGYEQRLMDALSYLDWVKLRFAEEPEVYNKFLNIMSDSRNQIIDTHGVVERVANLFHAHPDLIQGFNVFLPADYRIETGDNVDPNTITLVAPSGTTTFDLSAAFGQLTVTETAAEVANPK